MPSNISQTKNEIKDLIVENVKKEKPATTQQLIALVQESTGLSKEETAKLLIELENDNLLIFTKKQQPTLTNIKNYLDSKNAAWFWITIALSIATVTAVFTIPENAPTIVYVRSALGLVFVLFLPGYAFMKALFPSKVPISTSSENMDTIERAALSCGMSLVLTPIVGLILNYTPWGIRVTPVTLSLLALTVVFATAAILREDQTQTSLIK